MIAVPDSRLCQAATAYARAASEPSLFNHVMRTFAFGLRLLTSRSGVSPIMSMTDVNTAMRRSNGYRLG